MVALALAAPLAACGSRCLVTTTGAVTSELKCRATATKGERTGSTALAVVVKGYTYDVFRFTADLGPGAPGLATYDRARGGTARTEFGDCKDAAGCFFQVSGPKPSTAAARAEVGSFSLRLTRVSEANIGEAGTTYPVSGTADLTLLPSVGNGEPVQVHAQF